ncbi:MAG: glycosyltransferase [Bacteroidales bacterium]|nr:glycosyltransferase [Bacteroidales bacterium]
MKSSIHIIMALESFFPYSNGGTENSVIQLARYLSEKGYKITILTPDDSGKRNINWIENINIRYFNSPLVFPKEETFGLKETSNLPSFKRMLEILQPDILHLQSFSPALNSYHIKAAKELGVKTIYTLRLANNFCINNGELVQKGKYVCNSRVLNIKCQSCNLIRYKIKSPPEAYIFSFVAEFFSVLNYYPKKISTYYYRANAKKKELKRTAKYTDAVISISNWVTKAFQINNFRNISEIKQGIDYQIRQNKLFSIFPVVFTFIGRFSPEKGIDILISTLNCFSEQDFILNIISIEQNEDKVHFENVMNNCKFKGKIKLKYNLSTEQVYEELEKTHWLCLFSKIRDTAPRAIHEAFACQVPSIVSQHIPDFVEHNVNGLRINIDKEEEISSVFRRIFNDFSIWERLKSAIKPPRNISQVGQDHELLYHQIMNSK